MNVNPRAEASVALKGLGISACLSHIPFLHLAVLEISHGRDAFTLTRQVQSAGLEPSEGFSPQKDSYPCFKHILATLSLSLLHWDLPEH